MKNKWTFHANILTTNDEGKKVLVTIEVDSNGKADWYENHKLKKTVYAPKETKRKKFKVFYGKSGTFFNADGSARTDDEIRAAVKDLMRTA